MKNATLWLIVSYLSILTVHAQFPTTAQYDFDNPNNLLEATIGPNGLSIDDDVTIDADGIFVSTGCSGNKGIDFEIPGFVLDEEDFIYTVRYQRDESQAQIFTFGDSKIRLANGKIFIKLEIFDPINGTTYFVGEENTGHVIPHDDVFRDYTLLFESSNAKVSFLVDGEEKWSYNITMGHTIYWDQIFNLMVGVQVDNACENQATIAQVKVGAPSALPIELVRFEAEAINDVVYLKWETANEKNNEYFEIEKSKDGESFTFVDMVEGAGNSNELIDYQIEDDFPFWGTSYYRLKQVDFDGSVSYGPVVSVTISDNEIGIDLRMYPNPLGNGEPLNLESKAELNNVSISLFDMTGKLLVTEKKSLSAGPNTIVFPTDLSLGYYVVMVNDGKDHWSEKLLIR